MQLTSNSDTELQQINPSQTRVSYQNPSPMLNYQDIDMWNAVMEVSVFAFEISRKVGTGATALANFNIGELGPQFIVNNVPNAILKAMWSSIQAI